jgi:hypothetical protein
MFNIITIITIGISLINPLSTRPPYYQEYDLIGEIPAVEITATRYESNQNDIDAGMMPTIEVTAQKITSESNSSNSTPQKALNFQREHNSQDIKPYYEMSPEIASTSLKNEPEINISGDIPEVIVTSHRPSKEEMRYYGMMSEVLVTAERYPQTNTDIVYTRPNPEIDYTQSSVKHFYLYVLIVIMTISLVALVKIFLSVVLRPINVVLHRAPIKQHSHKRY